MPVLQCIRDDFHCQHYKMKKKGNNAVAVASYLMPLFLFYIQKE